MKSTSFVRISAAVVLFAATAFSTAMAEPVRHFSVEGTYRAKAVSEGGVTTREGNATTVNSIIAALDGKSFTALFDLDFGTVDSDGSLDRGLFTGAVKNTSATSGAFGFTPISNSCVNPALDCYVSLANDQFGVGIDSYGLRTGFIQSDALNTLVSNTIPGAGNVIGGVTVGTVVSTSFGLFASGAGLFSSPSLLGPTELLNSDPALFSQSSDGRFFFLTSYGPGVAIETGFVTFGFEALRISEVFDNPGPPTAVPEPETYALMLTGLVLMGVNARRRQAKQTEKA